jgi:uncharacterized protein
MTDAFREGVRLFNSGRFFEAHEALETIWLKAQGDEKTFLHGLIQIAAAFHHYTRRNPAGFASLLRKGLDKLQIFAGARAEIDLAGFLAQLRPWRDGAAGGEGVRVRRAPPYPLIKSAAPDDHAR